MLSRVPASFAHHCFFSMSTGLAWPRVDAKSVYLHAFPLELSGKAELYLSPMVLENKGGKKSLHILSSKKELLQRTTFPVRLR